MTSILLAPIYKIFGFNLIALKLLNVVCYGIFVGLFYIFCEKRLNRNLAIFATLFFVLNPFFLNFNNNILSDIPFLLFSFVAVVFLSQLFSLNLESKKLYIYSIVGSIFALFACLTRTNGIVILIALFLTQILFLKKEKIIAYLLPYFICITFVLITNYYLGAGGSGHLDMLFGASVKSITRNIIYYFGLFSEFFALPNPFLSLYGDFKYAFLIPNPISFIMFLFILPLLFYGITASFKRARGETIFISLFILGSVGLLIIWVATQGGRFLFSVMPFMVYYIIAGFSEIKHKAYKRALLILCAGCVLMFLIRDSYYIIKNIRNHFSAQNKAYEAYNNDALDIYDFIKNNTQESDIIVFFKPRVLYLNTNRLGFTTKKYERLKDADYVLFNKYEYSFLESADLDLLTEIYNNDTFNFYKIKGKE